VDQLLEGTRLGPVRAASGFVFAVPEIFGFGDLGNLLLFVSSISIEILHLLLEISAHGSDFHTHVLGKPFSPVESSSLVAFDNIGQVAGMPRMSVLTVSACAVLG